MPRILRVGLPDRYVTHGKPALLHAEVGFTGRGDRPAHRGRASRPRHGLRSPARERRAVHPQVRALLEVALADEGEPDRPTSRPSAPPTCDATLRARRRGGGGRRGRGRRDPRRRGRPAAGARLLRRPCRPSRSACSCGCTAAAGTSATSSPSTALPGTLANASGRGVPERRLPPGARAPLSGGGRTTPLGGRLGGSAPAPSSWRTDPARVVVGGDSAGGQPTSRRRAMRADERAAVRAQLLVYPALDAAMDSDSYREFADGALLAREGHGALLGPLPRRRGRRRPDAVAAARRRPGRRRPGLHRGRRPRRPARRRPALRGGAARGRRRRSTSSSATRTWSTASCAGAASSTRARELVEALGEYTRATLR